MWAKTGRRTAEPANSKFPPEQDDEAAAFLTSHEMQKQKNTKKQLF